MLCQRLEKIKVYCKILIRNDRLEQRLTIGIFVYFVELKLELKMFVLWRNLGIWFGVLLLVVQVRFKIVPKISNRDS